MEEKQVGKNKWLEIVQSVFWVAFIIIPVVTGILAYHWLPNESPMLPGGQVLKPYEILESHEACQDTDGGSRCETVADIWKNTETGNTYTKADFQSHRISERNRMTTVWFLYGLIGCIFFAGTQHYKKKDFFKYFGIAIAVNLAIAAFTYISSNA